MSNFSQEKINEFKDTLAELEANNKAIEKQISKDQQWIKDAEAEQTKRLARVEANSQELWETQGQIKIINQWIAKEEAPTQVNA